MEILIVLLIILTACNLFAEYHISKKIDTITKLQTDHNTVLIKLVYHKAMDLEDYETVAKIKNTMPKDYNYYKFF